MSLLYSSSIQHHPDAELRRNQEFMDLNHHHFHHQQQPHQHNSGLMRFRSAPVTFLESLVNGVGSGSGGGGIGSEDYRFFRPLSPEMDTMLERFMSSGNGAGDSSSHNDLEEFEKQPAIKQEVEDSQMAYQSLGIQNLSVVNSVAVENQNSIQATMGAANGSNLIRQNSSPPGLFSNLGVDNGFSVIRDTSGFRAHKGTNGEASSSTGLSNHISFSLQPRLLPQISEIGDESMGASTSPDGNINKRQYMSTFGNTSWDDTSFNGIKRPRDKDGNMFSSFSTLDNQNGNSGHPVTSLTHHLSLPKTAAEMATIEKLLQFQDSVPCKIRAKRGCATHPRSVAERVRRTRISERMRKLQQLFPNMDKQANTADMLELAVEHIKDLQQQVKTLADSKAKCTCSSKQKQHSNLSA